MEVLETINEVWAYNLKLFRENRTQAEIAEAVGLSLRGYQRLEAGTIPRSPGLIASLAKALNTRETRLFLDPDLTEPTSQQALDVLRKDIEGKTELSSIKREVAERLSAMNESEAADWLNRFKVFESGKTGGLLRSKKRNPA